jgi:lipopolysaccharide export system permease protein
MMLPILYRYIAKTVLLSTLLVITVVIALAFVINILEELKEIGAGDYGLIQAIYYALLRLPYSLYQFFPMIVLVGGVIGLSTLSSHRELIVMRTAGISIYQIIYAVVIAAFILTLAITLIGECLAPAMSFAANKYKDTLQNKGQAVVTASGVWLHEGNNFLHIDKVNGLKHLEGVTRFEFNTEHQLLATYFAKNMDYHHGHWHLFDEVRTVFTKDHTISQHSNENTWDLVLNPHLLTVGLNTPEEMSFYHLVQYSHHLVDNKLQATAFQFEFWRRIFQPLTILVMILLAIPVVLTGPRSALGPRLLLAIMIGFVFYIVNMLIGQFSIVFQLSPCLAALFPLLLFMMGGGIVVLYKK